MSFEFAIIGSTPMAALLACSLSKVHGRKTAFIGQLPHVLEPSLGFDISINIITRPKTLKLLKENNSQLRNLLKDFSLSSPLERIDPILNAHTKYGSDAVLHMKNTAQLYGFNIETQAPEKGVLLSLQARDALRILRRPFAAGLANWLERHDVKYISSNNEQFGRTSKEGIKITASDEIIIAQNIIIVDDSAILKHMPSSDLAKNFIKIAKTSLMLEPIKKQKSSVRINVEENAITYQHSDGAIDFIAPSSEINSLVYRELQEDTLSLAGKSQFTSLISNDGAGIFGNISAKRISYIGGFGISGAFLTPAMARVLARSASEFENGYFGALKPIKTSKERRTICEYSPLKIQRTS